MYRISQIVVFSELLWKAICYVDVYDAQELSVILLSSKHVNSMS
jgi:hypothetical protein